MEKSIYLGEKVKVVDNTTMTHSFEEGTIVRVIHIGTIQTYPKIIRCYHCVDGDGNVGDVSVNDLRINANASDSERERDGKAYIEKSIKESLKKTSKEDAEKELERIQKKAESDIKRLKKAIETKKKQVIQRKFDLIANDCRTCISNLADIQLEREFTIKDYYATENVFNCLKYVREKDLEKAKELHIQIRQSDLYLENVGANEEEEETYLKFQ